MKKIILASASPRRKELLGLLFADFDVLTADADEDSVDKSLPVHIYVQELAMLKAAATVKSLGRLKNSLVIGADTVVYYDGKILGKPQSGEEAFNMLDMLSANKHEVYTGICVIDPYTAKIVCKYEKTDVYFKTLSPERIMGYINTGEPADKAGAYGIQGKGSMLVSKIDGDYHNVVGLPVSMLSDVLKDEFDTDTM